MKQRPCRIAAIVALVAAAVVVVSLAVLVVRNVSALLAVLGALVIAGAAGWIAVTRRGTVRVLAAVAAAAALIGGVLLPTPGSPTSVTHSTVESRAHRSKRPCRSFFSTSRPTNGVVVVSTRSEPIRARGSTAR